MKALVHQSTNFNGDRTFVYLSFDDRASEFRIVTGVRNGNAYEERSESVPNFVKSATEEEKAQLFSYIATFLSLN